MCIIKASVHRASKPYWCEHCMNEISRREVYMRLFGMAHGGDKPYEVFEHLKCLIGSRRSNRNKALFDALDRAHIIFATDERGTILNIERQPA